MANETFTFSNLQLKAQILRDPRPGFRGACMQAYVALSRAKDAMEEEDLDEENLRLLEAQDWIEEAKVWEQIEVAPLCECPCRAVIRL